MSEEQLKAFIEKVKSDTELQEKLKAAASSEAALEIAKEAGFSVASEDIQSMGQMASEAELKLQLAGALAVLAILTLRGLWGLDQCQQTALDGGTTTQCGALAWPGKVR